MSRVRGAVISDMKYIATVAPQKIINSNVNEYKGHPSNSHFIYYLLEHDYLLEQDSSKYIGRGSMLPHRSS